VKNDIVKWKKCVNCSMVAKLKLLYGKGTYFNRNFLIEDDVRTKSGVVITFNPYPFVYLW
jgi:hypothetical protein